MKIPFRQTWVGFRWAYSGLRLFSGEIERQLAREPRQQAAADQLTIALEEAYLSPPIANPEFHGAHGKIERLLFPHFF